MDHTAIYRISNALRARIQLAYNGAGGSGAVYVGPLDDPDAAGAPLILFLYRLVPNPSMRNKEHTVIDDLPPHGPITYRDALPLDLYYLLTTGDVASSDLDQLKFFGATMQLLHQNPVLSGPELQNEAVKVTLDPLSNEEMGRIWALFPTLNFRTSVAYFVSPVWLDPARPDTPAAPVLQDRLLAGHLERVDA